MRDHMNMSKSARWRDRMSFQWVKEPKTEGVVIRQAKAAPPVMLELLLVGGA